jgi:hypothetical protein
VEQAGFTALHLASEKNYLERVQLLLTTKAAIDVKNKVRAAYRWRHTVF